MEVFPDGRRGANIMRIPSPNKQAGEEGFNHLKEIQDRHEASLLKISGVQGVGIAEENGQLVFAVLVSEDARVQDRIPETLEGIPLRVVRVKEIVAQDPPTPEDSTEGS